MTTTNTPQPVHALAWADKKLKLLVSTRGTTIETDPSRPSMVKMFFEPFNAVDTNDQYRQGILKLEENWKTHSWVTRTLSTILGVIFVNSHLAMRFLRGPVDAETASTSTTSSETSVHELANPARY